MQLNSQGLQNRQKLLPQSISLMKSRKWITRTS